MGSRVQVVRNHHGGVLCMHRATKVLSLLCRRLGRDGGGSGLSQRQRGFSLGSFPTPLLLRSDCKVLGPYTQQLATFPSRNPHSLIVLLQKPTTPQVLHKMKYFWVFLRHKYTANIFFTIMSVKCNSFVFSIGQI